MKLWMVNVKFFFCVCLSLFSTLVVAADVYIGMRAHDGVEKGFQQWQATDDYLAEEAPDHHFVPAPMTDITELLDATGDEKFDFVLTNPSSVVEMELLYHAAPILTRNNKRQGKGYTQFGSVVFIRAERDDITNVGDLKDKSFITVAPKAFGGWQAAWRELVRQGVARDEHSFQLRLLMDYRRMWCLQFKIMMPMPVWSEPVCLTLQRLRLEN